MSLNAAAASSCARQCIHMHVLTNVHRCEFYRWSKQRKDIDKPYKVVFAYIPQTGSILSKQFSRPKRCNGDRLTCWTGGLFCTQVATTSAARHLMEACESCSRLNSVGKPPIVCRSEAACSNVSSLTGGSCSVDNVWRCMQEGLCWKGLQTKHTARQQLYESGVSILLELDQCASWPVGKPYA